jgi:hypothetical protein
MSYFPDLSPYAYGHGSHPGVLHIGWLDGVHEYRKGIVSPRLIEKMKKMASAPVELYRGFHICELCTPPTKVRQATDDAVWWRWAKSRAGNGEIRVERGNITYAAPVLIVHYIEEHGYLPPQDFLQAVEDQPNP